MNLQTSSPKPIIAGNAELRWRHLLRKAWIENRPDEQRKRSNSRSHENAERLTRRAQHGTCSAHERYERALAGAGTYQGGAAADAVVASCVARVLYDLEALAQTLIDQLLEYLARASGLDGSVRCVVVALRLLVTAMKAANLSSVYAVKRDARDVRAGQSWIFLLHVTDACESS